MIVLGFDTATSEISVALHDGTKALAEYRSTESMRHGEMLAPGIAAVMSSAGLSPADLGAIVVGVGPGPFTGLRVGLVTATTMAWSLGIRAHGVCSLDVIAAEAHDAQPIEFTVATDARRKEVYVADYRDGRRVGGPTVVRPADVEAHGPVVGQGTVLYPDDLGVPCGPLVPSAAVMCAAWSAGRLEELPVEPLYLRRPDAVAPGQPKRVS